MKNKTLGSTLIVAGTTIGAGMLAMPISSAGLGFGMTMCLLFGLWALLTFSALLFIEVYQTSNKTDGIATLAEQYFGTLGRMITAAVLIIFMYAILSAYVTGGGSLIGGLIPMGEGTNAAKIGTLIFTFGLGAFVIFGISVVDGVNRLFFLGKMLVFIAVLLMMLPAVKMDNLMAMPINHAIILTAAPVFFTSFGFHVVIPSIVQYLDGDTKKLRIAITVGTAIPLAAYFLWQLATHGTLSQSEFLQILRTDPTLNGLVVATRALTGSHLLSELVRIFSGLALITSFFGVSLALFDSLRELLKRRTNLSTNRYMLGALTFLPPLAFALFYPQGFILALGYAGMMFAFYGLVLPIGLAWKARKQHPNLPYRVLGGNIALVIALVAGLLIIAIPFLEKAGYLPPITG